MRKKRHFPWPKWIYQYSTRGIRTPGVGAVFLFLHSLVWTSIGIILMKTQPLSKPIILSIVFLLISGGACFLGFLYALLSFMEEYNLNKKEKLEKEEKHKAWLENRKK